MFEIGKIPPEILEKIVMRPMRDSRVKRPEVLLRPKTGEDCSAVDFGGEYCVLSADPITGAAADVGYLAVNCNDIYAAGAEPFGLLLTVLLPPGSGEELLQEIMDGAFRGAGERNIEILGGHTEVTDAVCKPLVSAAVVGRTRGRKILSTGGARQGQDILMTKWAGTEGTAILAEEKESLLKEHMTAEELETAIDFYLAHPEARQDVTRRGRERILAEHTYQHRMNAMLGFIQSRLPNWPRARAQHSWPEGLSDGTREELARLLTELGLPSDASFDDMIVRLRNRSGELKSLEVGLLFLDEWHKQYS